MFASIVFFSPVFGLSYFTQFIPCGRQLFLDTQDLFLSLQLLCDSPNKPLINDDCGLLFFKNGGVFRCGNQIICRSFHSVASGLQTNKIVIKTNRSKQQMVTSFSEIVPAKAKAKPEICEALLDSMAAN